MAREYQPTHERTRHFSVTTAVFTNRWLVLTRSCWVVLVILSLGIFIGSFPVYLRSLQTVCTTTMCVFGQPTPETVLTLHVWGFSLESYATLNVVLILVSTVVWLMVGGILFWRKSNERIALLGSLGLMLQGTKSTENMIAASHLAGIDDPFLRSAC